MTSTGLPLVSIVIVNYNALKYLDNCLSSVFDTNYPNFEVMVVDNNSTDGSVQIARKYDKLTLIENKENKGFAEGCNQGITLANGEYIVLLNPDTVVEKTWLTPLIDEMEKDRSIGIIQSKLLLMDRKDTLDDAGIFLDYNGFSVHPGLLKTDNVEFNKSALVFSAKGAAMTIRSKILNEIGLLDSDFFAYLEESDLCWRAWLANYKVVFLPTSIVHHAWGASSPSRRSLQFMLYLGTRNRIIMLAKNLETKSLFTILTKNIIINILIALYFLSKGKATESWMIMKGINWNVLHVRSILKKRQQIQRTRKVTDKELFKIIMRKQSILELHNYHINFVKPRLSKDRRHT